MSQEIVGKIEKNWDLYCDLVGRIKNEEARKALLSLCEEVKDRLAASPASTRTDFVGAYPGGLVQHSLNVLKIAKDLNKVFGSKVDSDSLIITCLFHDIGKIGNQEFDFYIEQDSDWHRNRGMMYEINPKTKGIHVTQRSLWWLNGSGAPLSETEIAAISSLNHLGHMYSSDLYEVPMLSVILQTAVRVACIKGGGKTSVVE
jgi:putative nucleotidyltransferase with HDIG domain